MNSDRMSRLISQLTYAFSDAGLSDTYSTDKVNKTQFYLSFDLRGRLFINDLPVSYDAESIANISSDCSNKDKRGNLVCMVFDDGARLYFYKFGIEYVKHGKVFHNTHAVLAKLNYQYKTEVLKERVHPLIIMNRRVVAYCGKGEWVPIPDGVISIGEYAFEGSGIKRVKMPGSLIEICNYAFRGCKDLEAVLFDDEVDYLGNEILVSEGKKLVVIPERIKVDVYKAFSDVTKIAFKTEEV